MVDRVWMGICQTEQVVPLMLPPHTAQYNFPEPEDIVGLSSGNGLFLVGTFMKLLLKSWIAKAIIQFCLQCSRQ